MDNLGRSVTINKLKWDTEFFGVDCAKAILEEPITYEEWNELKGRFKDYQFISLLNKNSEPINAQLIGRDSKAFLADINIQFKKTLISSSEMPENVEIHQALKKNEQVIDLVDFQFSKFTEDSELAKRGGKQVYSQWILNAFEKENKYFALSKNENNEINGFLLFSYSKDACVIELIAVSKSETKGGIGSKLFKAIECEAFNKGFNEIKVGTQVKNLGAINFYHKVGCKQVESHEVYHLWSL